MPSYAYRAYTAEGRRRDGVVEAAGTSAAEQSLWIEGLKIVRLGPAPQKKTMADYFPSLYRISKTDLILFTRQLATFVGAGIPMSRALAVIAEETGSPLFKRVILAILDDLERGQKLSDALARHPQVFPALYIDLVRVAEITGNLEATLKQLSVYLRRDLNTLRRVRTAMIYPTVILVVATGVVLVLVFFALPAREFGAVSSCTGNGVFRQGLATVKEQMTGGEGFAGPLSRTGLCPPRLTQMVRGGEETGTLDAYLEQAADFYEEELDYRIRQMTSLIEPVMTVGVGLVVGFIAISLISAMYGLVGALK